MLQLFDSVALLRARPDLSLGRGQVGSVVEVYGRGEACEVEFVDDAGHTYALATFPSADLLRLVREANVA